MAETSLEPLPDDVGRVVEQQRSAALADDWSPPADLQAVVLDRLHASIAADVPVPRPPRVHLASALGGVVLGSALGGLVTAHFISQPAERPLVVVLPTRTLPAPVDVPVAPIPITPVPVAATPASSETPAPRAAPAPRPARAAPDSAREWALIDEARTALGQGDSALALSRLEAHRNAFPTGQLSEERDGLRILALSAAGRAEDAAHAAVDFERQFPNSMLLPAVQAAVAR